MADKTKRPKYIITGFIFSLWALTVFLSLIFFVLYPKIKEISQEKQDVADKIKNLETIKKKWISYSEFNAIKTWYKANVYLSSLLKKTDEAFYNENFVNNKQWEDYNSFFSKKILEVSKEESNDQYKEIQESYKHILPTYVEDNYDNEEWVMTDLKFVTYIESILYTFSLEIANKNFSVWNLKVLSEFSDEKETALDTTIFYIPYTFDITGKKKDVLDFIYFLENVWSISINEKWDIEFFEDNFINKALNGYGDANILKNQIIDIERIKMSDYIDSWVETNINEKLVDFIKRTQWNEKISITIDVRFYVKWVPNYKILEWVWNLATRYSALQKEFEKERKNKDNPADYKMKIEKWLAYLKELWTTINEIRKEKNDLNKAYKKVLEVNKILDALQETIKK